MIILALSRAKNAGNITRKSCLLYHCLGILGIIGRTGVLVRKGVVEVVECPDNYATGLSSFVGRKKNKWDMRAERNLRKMWSMMRSNFAVWLDQR